MLIENTKEFSEQYLIYGTPYRWHDEERPQPRVVRPPEESTQREPDSAPSDAVVLFDGTDLSHWESVNGGPAGWTVEQGHMEVKPGSGSIRSTETMGDCQLHLEFATPAEVVGDGQGRGNSGVFMMGHYEIQVLDSYENPTYADGVCAGVYGQYPPLVNASRIPGRWQFYDIVWIAPRFKDDKLASPAYLTLFHNGVVVHHNARILGLTRPSVAKYVAHADRMPLVLQEHKNPVRFRNIWYRDLTGYDE